MHLGVKSISSSRQHANERCCKRRPPSRMRDPRDRTDNTRENTMPVSSAFLVCQAHVKARLRKSPRTPLPSLSPPPPFVPLLSLHLFSVSLLSSFTLLHISLSLSLLASLSHVSLVLFRVVDTTVTVTNDTDVPRGYNGFKSRSFHLIHGHSSLGFHLRASPAPRHGHEFLDSYPTT